MPGTPSLNPPSPSHRLADSERNSALHTPYAPRRQWRVYPTRCPFGFTGFFFFVLGLVDEVRGEQIEEERDQPLLCRQCVTLTCHPSLAADV